MDIQESLNKLKKEIHENINSHIFLVETNNPELCLEDLKITIGDLISTTSDIIKKQITEENYIELIIIRPDGREIKKDQILDLQNRIKTKPILSDNIFYIITNADKMNDYASNKILKTIEEPNINTIGFLVTDNPDLILPTIKSRCEKIILRYSQYSNNQPISEEIINIVNNLIKYIEDSNHLEYASIKKDSKIIKENSKLIVNIIKDYYNTACGLTNIEYLNKEILTYLKDKNNVKVLIRKAKYMNKTLTILTQNMNIDLLLEKIFIELKDVK